MPNADNSPWQAWTYHGSAIFRGERIVTLSFLNERKLQSRGNEAHPCSGFLGFGGATAESPHQTRSNNNRNRKQDVEEFKRNRFFLNINYRTILHRHALTAPAPRPPREKGSFMNSRYALMHETKPHEGHGALPWVRCPRNITFLSTSGKLPRRIGDSGS